MTDNKEFQSITELFSHTIASIVAKSYRAGKQAGQEERDRLRELLSTAIAWTQDRGYDDPYTAPEWYIAAVKETNNGR